MAKSGKLDSPKQIVVDRPDDDDHDLLTFGEAGARLTEEIMEFEALVVDLSEDDAPGEELELAKARLAALKEAQERNRKPSLEEMRRTGFFRSV